MNSLLWSLLDWVSLFVDGRSLLGYYAVKTGKWLLTFRRSLMPSSSEPKGLRRDTKDKGAIIFRNVNTINQSTRREDPEYLNLYHLRGNIQSLSTIVVGALRKNDEYEKLPHEVCTLCVWTAIQISNKLCTKILQL